jgi:hypothetical protein
MHVRAHTQDMHVYMVCVDKSIYFEYTTSL